MTDYLTIEELCDRFFEGISNSFIAPVAQGIELSAPDAGAAGSIPAGRTNFVYIRRKCDESKSVFK